MTAGRALLAALALGFGLALVVAGPDLPGLTQGLPGRLNDDGLHAIYLHHQVHDALAAGRLDLSDPHQLWPVGAPLLRITVATEGQGVSGDQDWRQAAKTAMAHFRWMNLHGSYDVTDKIKELTWPGKK